MNKNRNLTALIGIICLILGAFVLSGCGGDDKTYEIAEELYAIGWILHNINDSTPTNLDYSKEDLAIYNYSFNYPAYSSQCFANILFWISPILNNAGGGAGASWQSLAVPLNRMYYVMGKNPVPEHYKTNWSMANYMHINYLTSEDKYEQFGLECAHEETTYENTFEAITPRPGEYEEIFFGTAPFIPTSIVVEKEVLKLKDHLIKGHNNKSYLLRETEIYVGSGGQEYRYYLAKPTYQIYLNNKLKEEGNLTNYYEGWDYKRLFYDVEDEDGNYLVNVTIPTNYPVWNKTIITAEFTKPSPDMNHPQLNRLEVSPKFELNKPLLITANFFDDSGISAAKIYYSISNKGWIELPITPNYPFYTTSLTVTDSSIEKINLKIFAKDSYNNKVTYQIFPVSLKARNINFSFDAPNTAVKGLPIEIEVICIDDQGMNCSGKRYGALSAKYYLNGNFFKKGTINKFEWDVPIDAPNQANFSVVFDKTTGVYLPAQTDFSLELITPPAYFTDQYLDYGSDLDNDGFYDYLAIVVEVNVIKAGDYYLSGHLKTQTGSYVDFASTYEVWLEPGIREIQLNFSGTQIRKKEKDGHYLLKKLLLETEDWTKISYREEAYTTSFYNYDEFEQFPATFTNDYFDYGLDSDGDGFYDYLALGVGINVTEAGNYSLSGTLETKDKEDIGHDYIRHSNLQPGIHFVELNFSGSNIYSKKTDGPYILSYIGLYNEEEMDHKTDCYETSYYDYKQFNHLAQDITGWIDWRWDRKAILNETTNITVEVYNRGDEDARNVWAALYDIVYLKEEIKVLLGNKSLGTVAPDEFIETNFTWKPTQGGSHILELLVNCTDDSDLKNNINRRYITVLPNAPDITGWFERRIGRKRFIVNETTNVTTRISNKGIQPALNTIAELYYKIGENYTLIESRSLGILAVDEEKEINFSWKPEKIGDYELKLIVSCVDDGYLKNNEERYYIKVAPNAPDVTGSIGLYNYANIVNENITIPIRIINEGGKEAQDIKAALYNYLPDSTKVLIWQKKVGNFSAVFDYPNSKYYNVNWKPTIKGIHKLGLEIDSLEDWNFTNNKINISVFITSPINVTFEIKNSAGAYINRIIALGYNDFYDPTDYFEINTSKNVRLPNASIDIGIAYDQSEHYGFYYTKFIESSLKEFMEATSEYYKEKEDTDNLILYTVYANKVFWGYDKAKIFLSQNLEDLNITDPTNLTVYICPEWNFSSKKCVLEWEEAMIIEKEIGLYSIDIFAKATKAEAFALGKPKFKPTLPKSLINNTGSTQIQGYLLLKVQKKKYTPQIEMKSYQREVELYYWWKDKAIIVDDLFVNNLRTIPAYSHLALDTIWAEHGSWTASEAGSYRVYAALLDSQGKVIETESGKLEDSYEFNVK